jgi:transcriptional regulator with XRE-family HTH domain
MIWSTGPQQKISTSGERDVEQEYRLNNAPTEEVSARSTRASQAIKVDNKGFNGDAFYRALETTVTAKGKTWKQVASETGVSASTLTRMAQGRRPDAASLAALSAWAGLNPSDFVQAPYKSHSPDAIAQISTLLRNDPSLDADSAETLEAIVKTAYERFKKAEK